MCGSETIFAGEAFLREVLANVPGSLRKYSMRRNDRLLEMSGDSSIDPVFGQKNVCVPFDPDGVCTNGLRIG